MLRAFIPQHEIENEVEHLLERGHAQGMSRRGPVDLDWLCEAILAWALVYDDTLPKGIEGFSDFQLRQVRLNTNVSNVERMRFTLAHELGHVVLHHPQLEGVLEQVRLFEAPPDPAALLRAPHIETQADRFGAALLLPRSRLSEFRFQPILDRVEQVYLHFQVSRQSARIRLQSLNLLHPPTLL